MDLVHLQKSLRFGWGQLVFKGPGKREMSGGSDVRKFSLCRIVPEAMYWGQAKGIKTRKRFKSGREIRNAETIEYVILQDC